MVERQLTSSQEVKEKYRKTGVVVFVLNQEGNTLVVRENSENQVTGKEKGSFGVVCETSREEEGWESTVIRGLREELGIDSRQTTNVKIDPEHCFLGESLFVEGVLARVAIVHWAGNDDVLLSASGDGEVTVVGWEKPEDLLSRPLREGVRKILQECLDEGLLEKTKGPSRKDFLPLSTFNLKSTEENF